MTRATIASGAVATMFVLIALVAGRRAVLEDRSTTLATPAAATPTTSTSPAAPTSPAAEGTDEDLLYGRVATDDGTIYQGRLRWGGDEEALWGNYFNGFKKKNPWMDQVPLEELPKEHISIGVFGVELMGWNHPVDLGRPFMARFGDIARIEPRGRDLKVTLKSGSVVHLDRFSADDVADGLRVWDGTRGVVDLGEWQIRSIDLLPADGTGSGPQPLNGTVHTRHGDFSGFVQWDREECLTSDELRGFADGRELSLRFDAIHSIERLSPESSRVTLLDGREILLSGTREVGQGNRGVYVDDLRYGRVLVSWDAFEAIDFSPGGSGPGYGDFPPGGPLRGSVVTRAGRRLAGRLVYDLDESETTETLDAPRQGVDYTIPFDLIASITLPEPPERGARAVRVRLRSGEELGLEAAGDLGEGNAGLLVFSDGRQDPEYVPWADVREIRFDPTLPGD